LKIFCLGISLSLTKKNKLTAAGKHLTKQQLLFTILMTFFCILITYFFWGYNFAKSALLGGLVAIIPQVIFGLCVFKYAGASKAQQVIDAFYQGEKIKLLLTVILFALAFKFFTLVPIAFFTVFCLVVITSLLTPFFLKF
jgi:ATP synthase protein I